MDILKEANKIIETETIKDIFKSFGAEIHNCRFVGRNVFKVGDKVIFETSEDTDIFIE